MYAIHTFNHGGEDHDVLRVQGKSLRHIAKALDPPPSTIVREVRRNNYGSRYLAHHAKEQALSRVKNIFRHPRIRDEHVRAYVVEKLKSGWSPEQIAGRIKIDCPGKRVSHEAIYQFVYRRYFQGEEDLRPCLRRRQQKLVQSSRCKTGPGKAVAGRPVASVA